MKIIKRNGAEEDFDINKIVVAVSKANVAAGKSKLSMEQDKGALEAVPYIILRQLKSACGHDLVLHHVLDFLH